MKKAKKTMKPKKKPSKKYRADKPPMPHHLHRAIQRIAKDGVQSEADLDRMDNALGNMPV